MPPIFPPVYASKKSKRFRSSFGAFDSFGMSCAAAAASGTFERLNLVLFFSYSHSRQIPFCGVSTVDSSTYITGTDPSGLLF